MGEPCRLYAVDQHGARGDAVHDLSALFSKALPHRRTLGVGRDIATQPISFAGVGQPFSPLCSRRHARLELAAEGGLTLQDIGSANGTFVNDERLLAGEARRLRDSDVVSFAGKRKLPTSSESVRQCATLRGYSVSHWATRSKPSSSTASSLLQSRWRRWCTKVHLTESTALRPRCLCVHCRTARCPIPCSTLSADRRRYRASFRQAQLLGLVQMAL